MRELIRILEEIRPEFDFNQVDQYVDNGILDSFDIIMLVSALEDHFSVIIDGRDIVPQNFNNLEAIARLIEKCGGEL